MTTHNIHKYYQCKEDQIHTELSPDTDGTFVYATDTQTLYISHNGGWIISTGDVAASNYTYADVDMNIITHLDASVTDNVLNRSGNPVSGDEPVHTWKDSSGRNDMFSLNTTGPSLSADSLNGLSVMNFTPKHRSKTQYIQDNLADCGMQSIRRSTKRLNKITAFVVCHDPTSVPWSSSPSIPTTTSGAANRFARPLIKTSGGFLSETYEHSGYMIGYRRYDYTLDRYYSGRPGSGYSQNRIDINPSKLTSEARMAPKILWSTVEYFSDNSRCFFYAGINGTHGLTHHSYSMTPTIDQLTVGLDQHHNIGEILLCNQTMDATELNKVGNHLSNKWGCPWDGFLEI